MADQPQDGDGQVAQAGHDAGALAGADLGAVLIGVQQDLPGCLAPYQPDRQRDPRLTVAMVARLQGFPDSWVFCGRKTAAYRQVGNAFPPPVVAALGVAIAAALGHGAHADPNSHHSLHM